MSANEIDQYKQAMASVRDMQINPETGRVTKYTNKSIVESIGNVHGELAQKNINIKLSGNSDVENKNAINVYKQSILNQKVIPTTINESTKLVKEEDNRIKVGRRSDEEEYMQKILKSFKKFK